MTILQDLDQSLAEYKDHTKLGQRILATITKGLYSQNEKAYSKKLSELYKEAMHKESLVLQSSILYKWLEFSDFKSPEALATLDTTTISILLLHETSQELRYKTLSAWIEISKDYSINRITDCLDAMSELKQSPKIYIDRLNNHRRAEFSNITKVYSLDDNKQLQFITNQIIPNVKKLSKHCDFKAYLSSLIFHLNLGTLQNEDSVKLLTLLAYLNTPIKTKLLKTYFPDNYETLLNTAQVLGVATSIDYWTQAFAAKTPIPLSHQQNLPELLC